MKSKKLFFKKRFIAFLKVHDNIFTNARGLMFSPPLQKKEGIILASTKENLTSIHMLFVFFPIDAIWLDKRFKVIHIAKNIRPFTFLVTPPRPAQYIIELPKGGAANIKVNHTLSLQK